MKRDYYFRYTYLKYGSFYPTKEQIQEALREMEWKGVTYGTMDGVWGCYAHIIDKGRGVQYKAFVKYWGALHKVTEVSYDEIYEAYMEDREEKMKAEEERRKEEERLKEEEARLKEEERLRKIREYNGPRRNPYFKWRALFLPIASVSNQEHYFTPVEMRSWFTFIQDLCMVQGSLNTFFWWFLFVPIVVGGWMYETAEWINLFGIIIAGLSIVYCVPCYLGRVFWIAYYLIKCYKKQTPMPEWLAEFPTSSFF